MRRTVMASAYRVFRILLLPSVITVIALPHGARSQGLELGGGWADVSGHSGSNGSNARAAWWFANRVTRPADYDDTRYTSTLTNFTCPQVGAISTKSHLYGFLTGPRIFFSTSWMGKYKLNPFGEAQFGVFHLSQSVTRVNMPTISASDAAFTRMLGEGSRLGVRFPLLGQRELGLTKNTFHQSGAESPEVRSRCGIQVRLP
jgi:hypothetical protein